VRATAREARRRARGGPWALSLLLVPTAPAPAAAQALPPPGDGDIRVVHWELRNLTDVWLTLEPRSPAGETLPISLTFNAVFSGKRPAAPLTHVELRAHVGRLWAPRPELTFVLDGGEALDLAGPTPRMLFTGEDGSMTAVVGVISADMLDRIAAARTVGGNALRLAFELTAAQRRAVGAYAERLRSSDPAQIPDPTIPVRPVR